PLTATISDPNGADGLTGSYNLSHASAGDGTFDLLAEQIELSVPGLLTADASHASDSSGLTTIDFSPALDQAGNEQALIQATNVSASILPLGGGTAVLPQLTVYNDGFAVSDPDASGPSFTVNASSSTLDQVLGITTPQLTISQDLGFTVDPSAQNVTKTGAIEASSGNVNLFPAQTEFTASVVGFSTNYDYATGSQSIQASHVDLGISDLLTIDATGLTFQLDPFSITIGSATASSPRLDGVGGSIDGLSITSDGFSFDDATLGAGGTVKLGSIFTFSDLKFSLTNFGFSFSHGASFGVFDETTQTFNDSTFGVSADSAALDIGSAFNASATTISGSVDLSSKNLGDFTFKAGTVTIGIGTFLELDGTDIEFDPGATTGDIADFGSITATLNVGSLSVSGSAQNFGIDTSGHFVAHKDFGVSFAVDKSSSSTVSSEIQWPSWLPIQIQQLSLAWPDLTDDPQDFTIDLSASVSIDNLGSVNNQGGSDAKLSGYVDNAILDTGLLAQNKFPLIGLGGVGIEASGDLFGAQLQGQFFLSMLRYDASGKVIPDDNTTTPVASSYLYGGIDAGIEIAGETGFQVRLGVSQLGPLEGYVSVSAPVILDPVFTGLALTDFSAGIQFDSTLPVITDARQMENQPDFVPSSQLSLDQWKSLLETSVENQVVVQSSNGGSASVWQEMNQPMTLEGGVTIFSAYASADTFKLKGDFKFDTAGHFFAQGDLVMGGAFDLPVDLYFNADDLAQGKGQILVLAQGPQQASVFTLYGGLNFDFGNLLDTVKNDVSGAAAPV
ncbi:MAG: hypothetical protein ACREHD_00950, partial [Pirellulales bacterium]